MRRGSSCTIEPFLVPPYPDEKRGAGFWDEYIAAPSAMHIIGQKQELRAETLAAHDGAGSLCRHRTFGCPISRPLEILTPSSTLRDQESADVRELC